MTNIAPKDPLLAIARFFLIITQGLLGLGGIAALIAIPGVILFRERLLLAIAEEAPKVPGPETVWLIAGVLALAVVAIAMAFIFTNKLRQIIDTVGAGDPFLPENAKRLTGMAWLMLVIQVVAVPLAGLGLYLAKTIEPQEATINAGFDLNGIIMVVLLFILARVFRKGSEMRADLEGTV